MLLLGGNVQLIVTTNVTLTFHLMGYFKTAQKLQRYVVLRNYFTTIKQSI